MFTALEAKRVLHKVAQERHQQIQNQAQTYCDIVGQKIADESEKGFTWMVEQAPTQSRIRKAAIRILRKAGYKVRVTVDASNNTIHDFQISWR